MIDKKDDDFLGQNIKGLMMSLIGQWNARMDDARQATEFAEIRPADISVFAQLRGRKLPLSELHREMGYSRQAAQQAIARLVAADMLQLAAVPGNKRDKLIVITEKGQRWRSHAAAQIREIEDDCAAALSPDGREELRAHLQALLKAMGGGAA